MWRREYDNVAARLSQPPGVLARTVDVEVVNIVFDRGQPVAAGLDLSYQLLQKGGLAHPGVADDANHWNHGDSLLGQERTNRRRTPSRRCKKRKRAGHGTT